MTSAILAVENLCEMNTTVFDLASSATPRTAGVPEGHLFGAAVGSSKMGTSASLMKARAMAKCCHCPPGKSVPSSNSRPKTVSKPFGNPSIALAADGVDRRTLLSH